MEAGAVPLPPRPGERRGAQQAGALAEKANALERREVCPECGFEFSFPNLALRYAYSQCPLCLFQLAPPTAMAIPAPHASIADRNAYTLCMARVSQGGEARRCERRRVGGPDSELCTGHAKILAKHGKLTYGRYDEEYCELHDIELPREADRKGKDGAFAVGKLSYDELMQAAKRDEEKRDLSAEDTMLVQKAREFWLQRERRGVLRQNPITTETIVSVVEPTFGISLEEQGAGKTVWLKNCLQAIMSLPKEPLAILSAVIGHRLDPSMARVVAKPLKRLVGEQGGGKLVLPASRNILALLYDQDDAEEERGAFDPCPGQTKFLKIRYCLDGVVAEVTRRLEPSAGHALSEPLVVKLPHKRLDLTSRLTVVKAAYGHPHDIKRTFNVTEMVQGLVDSRGDGQYIHIPVAEAMSDHFGEPCAGVVKRLALSYIVDPREGELVAAEAHDHLLQSIFVAAPLGGPTLTITIATLAPRSSVGSVAADAGRPKVGGGGRHGRNGNGNGIGNGSQKYAVRPAGAKTSIRSMDEHTLDVTAQVRRLIDDQGGDMLAISKGADVFSALPRLKRADVHRERFRGKELLLHIEFRANDVLRQVKLRTDTRHMLLEGASVDARPVDPTIVVCAAVYGHPTDPSLQRNVQPVLEARVRKRRGRILEVSSSESMAELFGDPCYPFRTNKVLQVRYVVRKMCGKAVVAVNLDGTLQQSIRIGWPNNATLDP